MSKIRKQISYFEEVFCLSDGCGRNKGICAILRDAIRVVQGEGEGGGGGGGTQI